MQTKLNSFLQLEAKYACSMIDVSVDFSTVGDNLPKPSREFDPATTRRRRTQGGARQAARSTIGISPDNGGRTALSSSSFPIICVTSTSPAVEKWNVAMRTTRQTKMGQTSLGGTDSVRRGIDRVLTSPRASIRPHRLDRNWQVIPVGLKRPRAGSGVASGYGPASIENRSRRRKLFSLANWKETRRSMP